MKNVSLWRYPRPWFFSRPLAFRVIPDLDYGQTIAVKVILHRHVLDVYLDDRHVLSRAVYDYRDGQFGLFVEDAEAEFGAAGRECTRGVTNARQAIQAQGHRGNRNGKW